MNYPLKYDFEIVRGDNWDSELRFVTISYDANGNKVKTPTDITGAKIYFTGKRNFADADTAAKWQKTVTVHTNAAGGISSVSLTPTDTNEPGIYKYDIQIKFANGKINSVRHGLIEIIPDITETTA